MALCGSKGGSRYSSPAAGPGGKLAAPMRGLARLCVERQEWEESIEYFDHALGLNPLYGGNW